MSVTEDKLTDGFTVAALDEIESPVITETQPTINVIEVTIVTILNANLMSSPLLLMRKSFST
jgi:hypothetical protein